MRFKYLSVILFLLASTSLFSQTPNGDNVLFVNINVSGGNGSGSSWTNAIPQLADALKWAHQNRNNSLWSSSSPLKIYVAKGLYLPLFTPQDGQNFTSTPTNPRDKAFLMVNNVKLYGGFAGTESSLAQRNLGIPANETKLSGDVGVAGNTSDNAYHVLVSAGAVGVAELNGFTVVGANGDYAGAVGVMINTFTVARNYGGGMVNWQSSPVVDRVVFTANYGGGGGAINNVGNASVISNTTFLNNEAYNGGAIENSGQSSVTIDHCSFLANSAVTGGAVANQANTQSKITNSVISGNSASTQGGGIYYYNNSLATLTNVIITGNLAGQQGGALYIQNTSPILTNIVISGNRANEGGAMYLNRTSASLQPILRNSIVLNNSSGFVGNSTVISNYSLVQGASVSSDGNIDATGITAAQLFINAPDFSTAPFAGGNYALVATSPVINKGNKDFFNLGGNPDLSNITNDLAGNPRISGLQIDIGAYEFQSEATLPVSLSSLQGKLNENLLELKWKTQSESNSSHFVVQASSNGSQWQDLGKVLSKAQDGNSSTMMEYSFSHSLGQLALASFGLLGLLLLPASKNKLIRLFTVVLGITLLISCAKDQNLSSRMDGKSKSGSTLYIRLAQVDLDGAIRYSEVINVR